MVIQVNSKDVNLLRFSYSPLGETIWSLRALADPKAYGLLLPWTQRTHALMPPDLRQEFYTFIQPILLPYTPNFFLASASGTMQEFYEHLYLLDHLDQQHLMIEMTVRFRKFQWYEETQVQSAPLQSLMLEHSSEDMRPIYAMLFSDPEAFKVRLRNFIGKYWEMIFEKVWIQVEPVLIKDIVMKSRQLTEQGIVRFLGGLGNGIEAVGSTAVDIIYPFEMQKKTLAEFGQLNLSPSVFTWPSVVVEFDSLASSTITYPSAGQGVLVDFTDGWEIDDFQVIQALSDETRLEILKSCMKSPQTTQGLSRQLMISEPAVSKHLKILQGVIFVRRARKGYFVEYSAIPANIEKSLDRLKTHLTKI